MEKELHKCLIDFFSKFESADNKWQESRSNLERVFDAFENQVEQLRHVTSPEVDNAELFKVEGLREQLIFRIHAGIEEEVARIQEAITRLHNNSQDLKNRLMKIESARSAVSLQDENMKELVSGTPYRPKLDLLLEWAIDVCDHYHNLYNGINDCMKSLDYKDEGTLKRLRNSFLEKELARAKINRILAHTQFLARETCK